MSGFGVYIRISKEGYRSDSEVEAQLDRYKTACRSSAAAKGLTIDESAVVTETDVSGGTAADDRALGALIARVESGKLAGIISPDVDRLARDVEQGCAVWRRVVEEADGRLVFATDGIDSADDNSKMMMQYRLIGGEDFLKRTTGKFAVVVKQSVEAGIHSGPTRPLGYTWPGTEIDLGNGKVRFKKSGPLKVVPDEAERVRAAFAAKGEGASWKEIVGLLGVKSQGNAAQILQNRCYLGEARAGKIVKPGAHPPIVSVEVWDRANRRKVERSVAYGTREGAMLGGKILRCETCKGTMSRDIGSRGQHYRCKHVSCTAGASVKAERLEPVVLEAAKKWHRAQHPVFQLSRAVDSALLPELERQLSEVESEIAEVEASSGSTARKVEALTALDEKRAGALRDLAEAEAVDGWIGRSPESVEQALDGAGPEVVREFVKEMLRVYVAPCGRGPRVKVADRVRFEYQTIGSEHVSVGDEARTKELLSPAREVLVGDDRVVLMDRTES